MGAAVSLSAAELGSLVVETCLVGVSLVVFSVAIYVLLHKRLLAKGSAGTSFSKLLFTVTVVLLLAVIGVSEIVYSDRDSGRCRC